MRKWRKRVNDFFSRRCAAVFFVAAVAAEREEVVGQNMIEALESRQLLSVPNIAGTWAGPVAQSVNGGPEQRGTVNITFAQRGTRISCVEADTLDSTVTYCRGTIDSKGRMNLNWSTKRSMRPVNASGVGRLVRGKVNFILEGFGNGTHVVVGFKVHRV